MRRSEKPTVIARTVARATLALILVTALAIFFEGHDAPGGGFIAGVMVAIAILIQYVVLGIDEVESRERLPSAVATEGFPRRPMVAAYVRIFAVGLLIAFATGVGAMVAGTPFMTSELYRLDVPAIGTVEVVTPLFFDLGVFFVVIGGLLTIVSLMGAE